MAEYMIKYLLGTLEIGTKGFGFRGLGFAALAQLLRLGVSELCCNFTSCTIAYLMW